MNGTYIDVYDTASTWYNSTVLSTRSRPNTHGQLTREVYVGYRIYEPTGDKIDDVGHFRGWSSRYDEWLSIRSPRIAPFNLMARRWVIPLATVLEESIIDDSNDIIQDGSHAYCVVRNKKCKSKCLIRNLNRFGVAGLFEFVI